MAKSYRNCNIRVSSVNNTEKGVVTYKKEDIQKIIDEWLETMEFEYFYNQHEMDEEDDNIHFHIVIRFYKNPVPFENIKSRFPYGKIESSRSVKRSVQYLIHMNDKSKKQYEWSDIVTNCKDMTKYKVLSSSQLSDELEFYIRQIECGKIKEYNQYDKIPIDIWAKGKGVINNSLTYYRERVLMNKHRNINVVFMSGDTGSGKTTFAKKYAEIMNKSYCISSSSNDFMQDYKGEEVFILDDLRDSDIKYTDILKLLDNHTSSTVISRYYNKGFIGDTIIITSYKPLSEWYINVPGESKQELYRRIKEQYQFKKNGIIDVFEYSSDKKKYIYNTTIKNNYKYNNMNKKSVLSEIIENMGDEFEIIKSNDTNIVIDDTEFLSIEEYEQEELPFE